MYKVSLTRNALHLGNIDSIYDAYTSRTDLDHVSHLKDTCPTYLIVLGRWGNPGLRNVTLTIEIDDLPPFPKIFPSSVEIVKISSDHLSSVKNAFFVQDAINFAEGHNKEDAVDRTNERMVGLTQFERNTLAEIFLENVYVRNNECKRVLTKRV